MAGQLYNQKYQWGVESSYGAAVAATRAAYLDASSGFVPPDRFRGKKYPFGRRVLMSAATLGPQAVSGRIVQDVSPSENVELALIGVKGGVTPSTPVGATATRLWTFDLGSVLDSATIEEQDGATAWQIAGAMANQLEWSGSAAGDHRITADMMAAAMIPNALTGAIAERSPSWTPGYQTKFYCQSALGSLPGSAVTATLLSWVIRVRNNLAPKFWTNNSSAVSGMAIGEAEIEVELTVEAAASSIATELGYAGLGSEALVERAIRLEFGNNVTIEGAFKEKEYWDIAGLWSQVRKDQSDGPTRVYQLTLQNIYEPTAGYAAKLYLQNARATAW